MQTFNYKLYHKDNTFKKVINPDLIQSDVRFTAQKNGGQGDLFLSIKGIDLSIKHSDIIRVFYSSDIVKNKLLYTGYIEEINQIFDNGEITQITAIGLGSYLTKILFQSGGLRTFTLNKPASEIITDIANYITTINPLITTGIIESTIGNINIEFENDYCFRALEKVQQLTPDFYFYVDQNGQINFLQNKTNPDYFVTFQRDLQSYISDEVATIFNKLYLSYDGGSKIYEDTASVNEYGLFEKEINDTNIKNVTTADKFASDFFNKNANPQKSRTIAINKEFNGKKEVGISWGSSIFFMGNNEIIFDDTVGIGRVGYEFIQPGEIIKILNFKQEIIGQIEKLEFKKDFVKLTLNKNFNFIGLIKE